ncbi:ATP-dependent DNA helicase [Trichonephila clavata]|uniref:ATP-dependent DNA helicase n=1 Tax=Trichonephila clavata TaxID=2740835 RepID=A0A8X6G909_TRICU|nr:ATP-dependent DNA helicase [Trichonephila clavata]
MSKNPHVAQTKSNKYKEKISEIRLLPWTSKHLSAFKYKPNVDYSMDEIVNLGPRLPCSWCRALKWKDETQGMCCSGGKVQLRNLEPYPEPLHSLLTHQDPLSEHFLSTIQDHREKDIRCGIYPGIKPELISQLQKSLHEHNKYIMDFKAAIDSVPKDQKEFKVVINAERKPFGEHKGHFNAPQTKEVAVVIVGQEFEKRDIVLNCRDGTLMRINETHRAYDALQYPLMFFRGEDGYQINIPKRHETTKIPLSKTVSASEYYSYRIMEHDGEVCHLLLFRNLLNQFLVDMFSKIESERLNWIRHNKKN